MLAALFGSTTVGSLLSALAQPHLLPSLTPMRAWADGCRRLLAMSTPCFAMLAAAAPTITPDQIYGHKDGAALVYHVLQPEDHDGAVVLYMASTNGWISPWRSADDHMSDLRYLLDAAFTVVVVHHRSAPRFKVPDAVADVHQAVKHLRDNAIRFGIDPNRLGVLGSTSGGHLALMLGLDPQGENRVQAVVAQSPIADRADLDKEKWLALDFEPKKTDRLWPTAVNGTGAPPVLLVYNTDERVPVSHRKRLKEALDKASVSNDLIVVQSAEHSTTGTAPPLARTAIVSFFRKHLGTLPWLQAGTPCATKTREQTAAMRHGDCFRDCEKCPDMVVVNAGSFRMGSPEWETDRCEDEGPLLEVRLDYRLAVGRYEVTFDNWQACADAGPCSEHRPGDQGWGNGTHPVVDVNWHDAKKYVDWLNGLKDVPDCYRLLTESEWEYVARAGTTTPFSTGTTIRADQANYDGRFSYGSGRTGPYRKRTTSAGTFPPNRWGIHDMHGNVREWIEDCWNSSLALIPSNGDPRETGLCDRRVVRGGSWHDHPVFLRSAYRNWAPADRRISHIGFRVARKLSCGEQ